MNKMNNMMHSSDDMTRLFSVQRAASRHDPFPDYALRKSRIDRLIALLLENRAAICDAVAQDFGKRSADNTLAFDVLPPLNSLKYARKNLRQWMRPERAADRAGAVPAVAAADRSPALRCARRLRLERAQTGAHLLVARSFQRRGCQSRCNALVRDSTRIGVTTGPAIIGPWKCGEASRERRRT